MFVIVTDSKNIKGTLLQIDIKMYLISRRPLHVSCIIKKTLFT